MGEEINLPSGWTPWAIMLGFVAAMAATVIMGIRAMLTGQLVSRKVHEEVRVDRDTYRRVAETALDANRELASNVRALVLMVEKLVTTHGESQLLIRQLVAGQAANTHQGQL